MVVLGSKGFSEGHLQGIKYAFNDYFGNGAKKEKWRNYLKWEINSLCKINVQGKEILTKIGARGKERQRWFYEQLRRWDLLVLVTFYIERGEKGRNQGSLNESPGILTI